MDSNVGTGDSTLPVMLPLRCAAGAAMSSTVAFLLGVSLTWRPVLAERSAPQDVLPRLHQQATTGPPSALSGCGERVHDRLFFGLGTPDGIVSDDAWVRFLAEIVTPRFPNGLTVVDANGQWRGLGEILMCLFPLGQAPADAETLGGIVMELTYGAASAFKAGPTAGDMVKLVLTGLLRAYGVAPQVKPAARRRPRSKSAS